MAPYSQKKITVDASPLYGSSVVEVNGQSSTGGRPVTVNLAAGANADVRGITTVSITVRSAGAARAGTPGVTITLRVERMSLKETLDYFVISGGLVLRRRSRVDSRRRRREMGP